MMYLISEEVGNVILNYLKQRPYVEVYQMIGELQRLEQVPNELLNNAEEILTKASGKKIKVAK